MAVEYPSTGVVHWCSDYGIALLGNLENILRWGIIEFSRERVVVILIHDEGTVDAIRQVVFTHSHHPVPATMLMDWMSRHIKCEIVDKHNLSPPCAVL